MPTFNFSCLALRFYQKSRIAAMVVFTGITPVQAENLGTTAQDGTITTTLVGYSKLPVDTFSSGPSSGNNDGNGQPISGDGHQGPFKGQPVQGFSGVQKSPFNRENLLFITDNGFGTKANSADFLLRLYEIKPNFTETQQAEVVQFINLSDPNHLVPFSIINELSNQRLLTGADFDVESFVIDKQGHLWAGDEFGPYLLHFDAQGQLLEPPIAVPGITNNYKINPNQDIKSPDNPFLIKEPNLGRSKGFEGLAISPNKKYLYSLLEGQVKSDKENRLRVYRYAIKKSRFDKFIGFYPTIDHNPIGDFSSINKNQFLVIERDFYQAEKAQFKKIFLVSKNKKGHDKTLKKELLVDLLNIDDPDDLNQDGNQKFSFPYVTIENILAIDETTLLIANDNNYPFSKGRPSTIDHTEIILVKLGQALKIDKRLQ